MKKTNFFLLLFLIIIFLNSCSTTKNENNKFYGNVDIRTVSLAFRVSGKITKINFDEGQNVKKGDILAKLDDSTYKAYLNEIRANIKAQRAIVDKYKKGYRQENIKKAKATLIQKEISLKKAKTDLSRNKILLKKKSISQQKYDDIKEIYDNSQAMYDYAKNDYELLLNGYEKEDLENAIAKLEALNAQEKLKEIALSDTVLYAPYNGTVLTRIYEVGSIVNASTPLIQLAKSDEYWVRSYMSEEYLGKIKPGMNAKIYTDSSNKVYNGVVSFISSIAEFTPKSVQTEDLRTDLVYRFRIVIKDFDQNIRQGMPVTIKFDNID
jgi:HlyD family secretion protein